MHRLLFRQMESKAHSQIDRRDMRNVNLLHAVETYPVQAASLLYEHYINAAPRPAQSPIMSFDDDVSHVVSIGESPPSSPERCKKRRRVDQVRLQVSPGRGFELMEGPNVLMFYDNNPARQLSQYPIIVKGANRRIAFEITDVDGEALLNRCDRSSFFKHLERQGSAAFRDLIPFIAMHLKVRDIMACSQTCKQWHSVLMQSSTLWLHHYARLCEIVRLPRYGDCMLLKDVRQACIRTAFIGADFSQTRQHTALARAFASVSRDRWWNAILGMVCTIYFQAPLQPLQYYSPRIINVCHAAANTIWTCTFRTNFIIITHTAHYAINKDIFVKRKRVPYTAFVKPYLTWLLNK
jgi:hypothetical protein